MRVLNAPLVELLGFAGSDESIADAARVIPNFLHRTEKSKVPGLINYLMEHRHGSPFEHSQLTFYVECPIAICREFERHRIGFSFQDEISLNVESGRYSELSDKFYVPATNRPIKKVEGFKVSRPEMTVDPELSTYAGTKLTESYTLAWKCYQEMLQAGIPREVARFCLPVGIYTRLWVSCNVRALCHFLSLRTVHGSAMIKSFPQWEIQQVSAKIEEIFAGTFPITHEAFNKFGRVGP